MSVVSIKTIGTKLFLIFFFKQHLHSFMTRKGTRKFGGKILFFIFLITSSTNASFWFVLWNERVCMKHERYEVRKHLYKKCTKRRKKNEEMREISYHWPRFSDSLEYILFHREKKTHKKKTKTNGTQLILSIKIEIISVLITVLRFD